MFFIMHSSLFVIFLTDLVEKKIFSVLEVSFAKELL